MTLACVLYGVAFTGTLIARVNISGADGSVTDLSWLADTLVEVGGGWWASCGRRVWVWRAQATVGVDQGVMWGASWLGLGPSPTGSADCCPAHSTQVLPPVSRLSLPSRLCPHAACARCPTTTAPLRTRC